MAAAVRKIGEPELAALPQLAAMLFPIPLPLDPPPEPADPGSGHSSGSLPLLPSTRAPDPARVFLRA